MSEFVQAGIIGLGKFGFTFGETLIRQGVNVLGIDSNPDHVKRAQHVFTRTLQADASDKETLIQTGITDMSHVLVSVGESIAASTMISMYLKELGVPLVWVKAINADHANLLRKVGVDDVIIPEEMAARQLANRLTIPGFIDYFPFNKEMILREINIEKWSGLSLKEIGLTNRYQIQAIALKKKNECDYSFIPKADEPLQEGDKLVVIGEIGHLDKIRP
ncbi:MAG: TrkA family potassium uptake protein [Proteobacteria bacterium]|nr:TrkA family potassium uptake protein [Pseudomonadota bacterium]MBU1737141.1 TrkA family potassium uptake protein [Pseudomonadota bacterium]